MGKILVADSDPDFRKLVQFALRFAGYDVAGAATGEECCRLAKEISPDLILLNNHLPDMHGTETCKALKLEIGTADIPVVLILDPIKESDQASNIEECWVDIIYKPIAPDTLTKKVNVYFKKRNP